MSELKRKDAEKLFALWDTWDQVEKSKHWNELVPYINKFKDLWYTGKRATIIPSFDTNKPNMFIKKK